MTRLVPICPVLLLCGCVPDQTHEAALMRIAELERQLAAVQSTLTIVEITLVIVAGLLALCLVSIWRLSRKGGHN